MIHIEPLQPDDWPAALALALGHVPADKRPARLQQCLHMLGNGLLDPRGVWVARQGATLVATQVCVPLAGAACLFWLPTGPERCADALVQAGLDWCRSFDCKLAQALAKPNEGAWTAPLARSGFRPITRLFQWEHDLRNLPGPADAFLRFERYRPSLAAEFAATLERTYDGTLDCPELNDVRTIDEIMAGHRGQGRFQPDFWWLAYDGDRPAGVVLLAEMPDGTTWELAYLGLAPEYRGRGLARALVTQALRALRNQPATHMILAVDERNVPARRLYQALGFVETERSDVFLFVF